MQKILNNGWSKVIFGIVLICGGMGSCNVRGADRGEGEEIEPGAMPREAARVQELVAQVTALKSELAVEKNRVQDYGNTLTEQIALACRVQNQHHELQTQYNAQSQKLEYAQTANNSLRKSLEEATTTRENAFKDLRAAREESRKLSEENQKLKQELDEARKSLVSATASYKCLEAAYQTRIVERNKAQQDAFEVPSLQRSLLEARREVDPLRAEVKRLLEEKKAVDSLRAEVVWLKSSLNESSLIKENKRLKEERDSAYRQTHQLKQDIVAVRKGNTAILENANAFIRQQAAAEPAPVHEPGNSNKRWRPTVQKVAAFGGIAVGLSMAAFFYSKTWPEAENNSRPVAVKK
jgi:chromosome segregation ATPase